MMVSEDVVHRARKKVAEANTSVSRLVGRMLQNQMRLSDDYWRGYEHWKKIQSIEGGMPAEGLTREEAHGAERFEDFRGPALFIQRLKSPAFLPSSPGKKGAPLRSAP